MPRPRKVPVDLTQKHGNPARALQDDYDRLMTISDTDELIQAAIATVKPLVGQGMSTRNYENFMSELQRSAARGISSIRAYLTNYVLKASGLGVESVLSSANMIEDENIRAIAINRDIYTIANMISEDPNDVPQEASPDQLSAELEQEKQLRIGMGYSELEDRVWTIIGDALDRHDVPDERDVSEWNMLYGMEIDATVFTHKNGPYSGTEKVSGVVYPDDWEEDKYDGPSPKGFQINGEPFDAENIAVIHDISRYQSFGDIRRDFAYHQDIERTQRFEPY
jgi:hypothetical protein